MPELSRREMLEAAAAAAAAGVVLGPVASASAATPEGPTSPRSTESNKLALSEVEAGTVAKSGSIAAGSLAVLADHAAGVAMLRMDPGSLREPHWHPNCWELQIPLSGTGTLGVVNPDGTWSVQKIGPGDIGFIPAGFAHYTQNTGNENLLWVLAFNAAKTTTINLSSNFQGMPTHTFAETLGVPKSALANATKGKKPRVFVP